MPVMLLGLCFTVTGCTTTTIKVLNGGDILPVPPGSTFTAPAPKGVTMGYWVSDRLLKDLHEARVDTRRLQYE